MLSVRLTGRRPPGRRSPARRTIIASDRPARSEEHTSELQSPCNLVCRLLLEKKKTEMRMYHFALIPVLLLPPAVYPVMFMLVVLWATLGQSPALCKNLCVCMPLPNSLVLAA